MIIQAFVLLSGVMFKPSHQALLHQVALHSPHVHLIVAVLLGVAHQVAAAAAAVVAAGRAACQADL